MQEPQRQAPSDKSPKIAPVPMAPRAISPSKISTASCPYRYWQVYVRGVNDSSRSPALALGSLAHRVAERWFSDGDRTGHGSWKRLEGIAEAEWANRHPMIDEDLRDDFDLFMDKLREVDIDHSHVAGVERRFAFDAEWQPVPWDSEQVVYGGMADLVTVRPVKGRMLMQIYDWTTATLSARFGAKKTFQLRFYAMLARQATYNEGKLFEGTIRVTARSLRTGAELTVDVPFEEHDQLVKSAELEAKRIAELADLNAPPDAIPGSECGICLLRCPFEVDEAERVRIEDEKEALARHRELIWIEQNRSRLLSLLKSWVGRHGPVAQAGKVAEFRTSESLEWDPEELRTFLRERDYREDDWLGVLRVDRKALQRLLKGDKERLEEVEQLATRSTSERFYGTVSEKR